ncbi:hypothetical protein HO173_000603 [Letharia columbiana]|uniref:N-acetyltransferase domain-containing protein n=1 Tax=Letharia columbiana TaxID=112416 RepID=A0A8H6G7J1_9LECA|nr:uncharacterized protein HO173_000603 [Letharia columbiana]KAF6241891.1 hypothetical protein HO173_000603 [Letharia columbiana]
MKFSVHAANSADCPALATLSLAAFKDDPIVGFYAKNVPPDIMHAYQCQQYRRRLQTSSLNGLKVFKVVDDDTREIVAVARWQIPYSLSVEQQAEKEKLQEAKLARPEGYNKELEEAFSAALDKLQEKWVDDSKDYVLLGLAVSPSHQRLGLGSLLIRGGLAMADEVGGRVYLESSAVGMPLYLKHGFKPVDDILIDMRPYGGTGIASEKCMMREPGGK